MQSAKLNTLNQLEMRMTDLLVREGVPRGSWGYRREAGELIVIAVVGGAVREYPVRGRGDTALMMTAQQILADRGERRHADEKRSAEEGNARRRERQGER